jgi:hypothetical protein
MPVDPIVENHTDEDGSGIERGQRPQRVATPATLVQLSSRVWPNLQRVVTQALAKRNKQLLEASLPPAQRAHYVSCCGPGATAFEAAFPTCDELRMTNTQYLLSFRRLLGLQSGLNTGNASYCCCKRGRAARAVITDYHMEICGLCRKLTKRHDRLNLQVVKVMRLAGAYVGTGEPRGLPGFGQGGGDALVVSASAVIGNAITDITVVHEQQPTMLPRAASEPLHAAEEAEKDKRDKFAGRSRALGYNFFPLVMEHGGAFGPTFQTFLRALRDLFEAGAEASANLPGANWSCSTFMQHAVQRLSVTFQKETADGEVALAQRLARSQADGFYPPDAAFPIFANRAGEDQSHARCNLQADERRATNGRKQDKTAGEEEKEEEHGIKNKTVYDDLRVPPPATLGPLLASSGVRQEWQRRLDQQDRHQERQQERRGRQERQQMRQMRQEQQQEEEQWLREVSWKWKRQQERRVWQEQQQEQQQERQVRQEQQQDRFGGGAPGGSSPIPVLGRGLGSTVVLMDDVRRRSEEEATECLKTLLG